MSSSGSEPNAIAQHGDLVYVLNTGGSSNVAGFRLEEIISSQIDHSLAFLSTNTAGAASIAITPDGRFVVVTERLATSIDVFKVLADGTLAPIVINPSVGRSAFFRLVHAHRRRHRFPRPEEQTDPQFLPIRFFRTACFRSAALSPLWARQIAGTQLHRMDALFM